MKNYINLLSHAILTSLNENRYFKRTRNDIILCLFAVQQLVGRYMKPTLNWKLMNYQTMRV